MSATESLPKLPSNSEAHENVIPPDLARPGARAIVLAAAAFVLLLAAMFLIGYFPRKHMEQRIEAYAAAVGDDTPVVQVASPKPSTASSELLLPADVRPNQTAAIYPRANGYLVQLKHDIHDRVEAGELLAVVDTPEVDAQLDQAQAAVAQAQANVVRADSDLQLAQTTLKRYTQAHEISPGSVTQEDLDTRKSAVDSAAAAVKQADANVAAAKATVHQLSVLQGYERVYAPPFAGVITARNFDLGALLNPSNNGPGKELFDVAETDPLRVFINVPQTYATSVQMGQPAKLIVRNFPGREFDGTVVRSSSSLDPATRTLLLEIHFPNPKGELYAGMYGQVKLNVHQNQPMLTIPSSALVFNAQGTQVAVVREDTVHFQPVALGRDLGTELEVISGVSGSDQVVTNPSERLADNAKVRVFVPDRQSESGAKVAAAATR